ncbi:hypothetical protein CAUPRSCDRAFT_9413, partial [Caulochytrium protostelioides]
MRPASVNHRSQPKGEEFMVCMDATTQQCLHYEYMEHYLPKRKIRMDLETLKGHPDLLLRRDLIDPGIDICSVDVPALFTENFDYQQIRQHFVRGILESDLLGKKIYIDVAESVYANNVSSPQMYNAVSMDILSRWTWPVVPDSN